MTLILDLGITLIYFTVFAVFHSFFASKWLKRKLANGFPGFMPYYRITYNLISLVSFYFYYYLSPKQGYTLYDLPTPIDLVFATLQMFSFFGLMWCFRYMSGKEFLGITQILRARRGVYRPTEELDEISILRIEGPYKFSRHPIYMFSILFIAFRPQMQVDYLFMIILFIAYFYIGSIFEEKKLIDQFGEDYLKYQRVTGRIFPKCSNQS
jgi:protein-S-isoprenylcysteine O-methyltransferase Ste14